MNFQTIPPVPTAKHILDVAFRGAREQAKQKKLRGNWLQIIRQKEKIKLDIVKDRLTNQLQSIGKSFPQIDDLPLFYQSLAKLTLDQAEFRQSCAAMGWGIMKITGFHRQYSRMIAKTVPRGQISDTIKEFYGRVSSVIKQIDPALRVLGESRGILRTYPDIKEMFTVCIYGFPNVGKTTLLNTLTGSRAKVASYAFTTTTINSGFMMMGEEKIQVLDVPGTLAREKQNLVELQAELVLKEVADIVIYVFDLSGTSGYSVEKQEQLWKKVSSIKPVLVYLSKTDVIEPALLKNQKFQAKNTEELKKEIALCLKNRRK